MDIKDTNMTAQQIERLNMKAFLKIEQAKLAKLSDEELQAHLDETVKEYGAVFYPDDNNVCND